MVLWKPPHCFGVGFRSSLSYLKCGNRADLGESQPATAQWLPCLCCLLRTFEQTKAPGAVSVTEVSRVCLRLKTAAFCKVPAERVENGLKYR